MLTSVVPMHIPAGLGALLAKLGLQAPGEDGEALGKLLQGDAAGAAAHGLTAKGKEGALPKGMELGPDGELLSGLGYNNADKESGAKNANEKTNVERFVQESSVERAEPENPFTNLGREGKEKTETKEKLAEQTEVAEQREAKDGEVRRDEVADEARVLGQHEAAKEERVDKKEVDEAEARDQSQQQDDDEEDKPGAGWVAEELEDEEHRKRGLYEGDPLGDVHRCRGTLHDGTPCLRKPVKGAPYCREHAAGWRVQPPIGKA